MFGLNDLVLGNSILRWLLTMGVTVGMTVLASLLRRWLASRLAARAERTGTFLDDSLANFVFRTRFLFILACSITLGGQFLNLPKNPERFLNLLFPIALILQLAAWGHWGVGLWIDRRFEVGPAEDGTGASRAAVLGFIFRLGLWSLVLLMVLNVIGFNITTLLASLGIGGIAVALALQNVLGDLFASLAITLDKPFIVGDFITLDQVQGTVQFIGLKTTRIRSLSGELIIISNGDLLKSRIRNFQDMQERRVAFGLAISYRTPAEKVALLPAEFKRIIEAQPKARFERAHFKDFSTSGLSIEVVYDVLDPDYTFYMDTQQAINLAILLAFRQQEISFSFPYLPGEILPG